MEKSQHLTSIYIFNLINRNPINYQNTDTEPNKKFEVNTAQTYTLEVEIKYQPILYKG